VNGEDAAVAHLVAERTYKRPQVWEVPENAERLMGIRSTDRCVVSACVLTAAVWRPVLANCTAVLLHCTPRASCETPNGGACVAQ
jgi:hypothetical protein